MAAKATNTVTGMVVERQTVADNEVMMTAAETTAGAAQTLTSDLAQTELKDVIVDNHQMTLSATISSSTQWVNFQGFEIKYRQPFVTVEIPQSGYTTFYYSDQSFLLPEGMEAYTTRQLVPYCPQDKPLYLVLNQGDIPCYLLRRRKAWTPETSSEAPTRTN